MAKIKLSLVASPTFKAPVPIPVAGGKAVDVEFTFKHRTRDEYKTFIESLSDKEDSAVILEMASGWDLEDAFDAENIEKLCQNHVGSGLAVLETYVKHSTGGAHRAKN